MAPTLFGKKIENCLTRGPSIFALVCGRSTSMWRSATRPIRRAETRESMASAGIFLQTNYRSHATYRSYRTQWEKRAKQSQIDGRREPTHRAAARENGN